MQSNQQMVDGCFGVVGMYRYIHVLIVHCTSSSALLVPKGGCIVVSSSVAPLTCGTIPRAQESITEHTGSGVWEYKYIHARTCTCTSM